MAFAVPFNVPVVGVTLVAAVAVRFGNVACDPPVHGLVGVTGESPGDALCTCSVKSLPLRVYVAGSDRPLESCAFGAAIEPQSEVCPLTFVVTSYPPPELGVRDAPLGRERT